MSEATELLERMEHAGHGGGHGEGGHGKGPGTLIGITMAVLGVMLAFCAAMVGTERTELIKGTIDQSNKWGIYQAEATKTRVMEADVEMLHALTPNKAELKKFDEKLATVKRAGGKSDDEDTAEIKEALHVATTELADLLTPDQDDEDRIKRIGVKYKHDMAEAKEDAESYESANEAHYEASEWYERAQLCAEVGIVIASIALLLSSRVVWIIAILFGVASGGIIGRTFVHTREAVGAAEKKIDDAKKHAAELEKDDDDDDDDKAKKPEGDGKKPEGDGKKPEGDGKKPEGDGKKPEGDGKKPEGDKKPKGDQTAPHP